MRAIVIDGFGDVNHLVFKEIPEPEPKPGHAVIEIKAFGINHAEMHMRRGEWPEAAPVSGIECVGVVKSCPGGSWRPTRPAARWSWSTADAPVRTKTPGTGLPPGLRCVACLRAVMLLSRSRCDLVAECKRSGWNHLLRLRDARSRRRGGRRRCGGAPDL